MRRLIGLVLGCALLAGCGSGFKDEREEYSYLSSLSNPTPEQWRRRQELTEKFKREEEEYRVRAERQDAERARLQQKRAVRPVPK